MIKRLLLLWSILSISFFWAHSQQHPKNLILMIGDGMGLAHIQAAYFSNNMQLSMLDMPVTGLQQTRSADNRITDSGASATAIATGISTYDGAIGMDTLKQPVETLLELAEAKGMSTGLIATSSITHATPAAFAAHVPDRNLYESIAMDIANSGVDFMAGGGYKFFKQRTDGRDLCQAMQLNSYVIHAPGDSIHSDNSLPVAYFMADDHLPKAENRDDFLLKACKAACDALSSDQDGFFLMVEGSQIDWGAHSNSEGYVISEVLDFDKAVAAALAFAEKDGQTLVIVTADHETGGMTMTEGLLGAREVKTKFSTMGHSAVMVPVFAYGPGAEQFTGVYRNTDLNHRMREALGL